MKFLKFWITLVIIIILIVVSYVLFGNKEVQPTDEIYVRPTPDEPKPYIPDPCVPTPEDNCKG